MANPMIETLCGAVDASTMMRHLEEFARRVKLSGTKEERESFRYLQSCLDAYGFRTELIEHDAYISLPGRARIEIGSQTPDCITHSFSRPSGPGGVRGSVVYAGTGSPADFAGIDAKGRIVLLEHIANPAASLRASQAGAIGQIHISPHRHLHEMCISSVWGSPTEERIDALPRTVVLSLRKEDGDALKRRVQASETVQAVLHAEVDTGWRKTPHPAGRPCGRRAGCRRHLRDVLRPSRHLVLRGDGQWRRQCHHARGRAPIRARAGAAQAGPPTVLLVRPFPRSLLGLDLVRGQQMGGARTALRRPRERQLDGRQGQHHPLRRALIGGAVSARG